MAEYDRCHQPFIPRRAMADGYPLETMLRIHCMQRWCTSLSDGCHGRCPVPKSPPFACLPIILDERPAGSHHHLEFPPPAPGSINWPVSCSRPSIAGWPEGRRHDDPRHLVDATIIESTSSAPGTKAAAPDPEMHQTRQSSGTLA